MSLGRTLRVPVALSCAVLASALAGCASDGRGLEVAGDVRAELDVVTAPAISAPATPTPQEAAAGVRRPAVAGRLLRVFVRPGDRVVEGQRIAVFDITLQRLDVAKARAGREGALAQVEIVRDRMRDAREKRRDLDDAERRLLDTRRKLRRAESGLREAQQLRVQIGLAQVREGLARIREGRSELDDALRRLDDAERLLSTGSDAKALAVSAAESAVARATVRAPAAGVVTFAAVPGEVLNVGAPVAKLQPDAPALVDVYVPAAEVAEHDIGHRAAVRLDSLPGRVFEGRVVQVGRLDEFPPTSYPTKVVHLTRAVRMTVRLDGGSDVPRGVPVDVVLY